MELIAQVLRSEYPPLFVGCWGFGEPQGVNPVFAKFQTEIGHRGSLHIFQEQNAPSLIAALSAAEHFACVDLADAWGSMAKDTLTLGRDLFGRVPLYWLQVGSLLWFTSRFQLLLSLVEQPTVCLEGLYAYSCFSYIPSPFTPVQDIAVVPPGKTLTWQRQAASASILLVETRRPLEWQEHPVLLTHEATAITQLQLLLKASTEQRLNDLPQNEPVGIFLSGGLDSAITAALLVRAGVKVRAYTLDFGDEGMSEYPYAAQVAQYLNIPLVKVLACPSQVRGGLSSTVQALGVPFGDGVTVPLFLLAQAACQETNVVFNGEGGDQLFGGWTNKPLIAASIYQEHQFTGTETFKEQYLRTFHRLWGYEAQIYTPERCEQVTRMRPQDWITEALDVTMTPSLLHRLRRANLMLKGAQNIQPRATQLGFAHGLKIRSLFCDLPLAQWTFSLAGPLYLQGACEKYILKKAVEDWLPSEVVWRTKRGMGVPLTAWCFNHWWHDLGRWLNPDTLRVKGDWQPHLAEQLVKGELGGLIQGRRIGESLWLIIMWEIWQSQVLKTAPSQYAWDHPFWMPHWLWKYSRQLHQ